MQVRDISTVLRAAVCSVALALVGCGGEANDAADRRAVDRTGPVDSALYAGDVTFRIPEALATPRGDIPFTLYLGLVPQAETRLGARGVLDLRDLQSALPDLLSVPVEPSCALGLDVDFQDAEAEGEAVRAQATVVARLYRCRERGTAEERRGGRLFTQTIDVAAKISANAVGECVAFRLVELELDPRGLLGGLATLLGVTERARAGILAQARDVLSENPVCPDLPEALARLDPRFTRIGLVEVGNGGVGVALAGDVELGAQTLLDLLLLPSVQVPAAGTTVVPVREAPGAVDVSSASSIEVRGREVSTALDVHLSAVAPTRIAAAALLDLRDLQRQLPEIAAGEVLVDTCGGRVVLRDLRLEGRGTDIAAHAGLDVVTFECLRTGPGSWERGAETSAEQVGVRAGLSVRAVGECLVFRLFDLRRDPPGALAQLETGSGRAEAARGLLQAAVDLILEESPLCPELPPLLAVLDPTLDKVSPQELGAGGVGIALEGTVGAGPDALVALLTLLQQQGVVPPAP